MAGRFYPDIAVHSVYGVVGNTTDAKYTKEDEAAIVQDGLRAKQRLQACEFTTHELSLVEIKYERCRIHFCTGRQTAGACEKPVSAIKMIELSLFFAMFFQVIAFMLWIMGIRPFLKEHGLYPLRGVDGLSTVINDIQQALEVSKKKGNKPISLSLLITAELISAAFFIIFAAMV